MKEGRFNLGWSVTVAGVVAGLLGGAAGGCASAARSGSPAGGANSATRPAALFANPEIVDSPFDDLARRDRGLALAMPEVTIASAEWPEPGRPSLENPRSIYLYSNFNFDRYLYFAPDRRR